MSIHPFHTNPISILFNRLLYGLLPGQCVLCKGKTHRQLDLCLACQQQLPFVGHSCWRCGLALAHEDEVCTQCLLSPPTFAHCYASFRYEAPIDLLIHQFKNQHRLSVGKVLSTVLAQGYIQSHLLLPDEWIPVPLHKNRLKQRGFNQALEIAEVLSDATGIPSNSRRLRRIRDTSAQKSLGALARRQNILGAFSVDGDLNNLTLGLVDDVVTTAATVTELTNLLLSKGASEIQVVCLARTLK